MATRKNQSVDDLLSGEIPGADDNTLESTIVPPTQTIQSAPPPPPGDGDLDDLLDEDEGNVLSPDEVAPEMPGADSVLIHFVEDGLSVLEQMWYKGQELEVPIGSRWWEATLDRDGESWMLLDEETQIQRWGKVFFRPGPWPGADFEDARALERERKRGRRPSHPNPGSLFPSRGRG